MSRNVRASETDTEGEAKGAACNDLCRVGIVGKGDGRPQTLGNLATMRRRHEHLCIDGAAG
jgi:hypothetical protein